MLIRGNEAEAIALTEALAADRGVPGRLVLPADPAAAGHLREWVAGGTGGGLDVIGLDLGGAELAGGDFSSSWFMDARLVEVRLAGASFYRADLQGADLTRADLSGACLVRANLDDAVLRDCVLAGADLAKASLYGVDARGASCRGTRFQGASLLDVDLRGADLRGAEVRENTFQVRVDERTRLKGLTGSVFGPVEVTTAAGTHRLSGSALEEWLHAHGAKVQVLQPAGTAPAPTDG
ncbi:pentapeptide repeat-containing protein [Streptomyces sp. NPDC090022]|uniref:pentapeptide repeat-containing protein n=1 Tax=Streptomyces sp. NPDC090022 TaxID=3365920 RepID=UPI00380D1762